MYGIAYKQAGPILAIHIWASIFVFLGVSSGKWFLAENRLMLTLQRSLLGAITNILLNYLLIPKHGIAGAAFATVVSYSITAFFYDYLQSETKIIYNMKLQSLNIFGSISRIFQG